MVPIGSPAENWRARPVIYIENRNRSLFHAARMIEPPFQRWTWAEPKRIIMPARRHLAREAFPPPTNQRRSTDSASRPRKRTHVCVIGLRAIPFMIGGVEAHCQKLYPEMLRQDDGLRVTILIRKSFSASERFDFEGLQVKTIWSPKIWGVDTLVYSFLSILYARLFVHPDLVHLHGIGPGFFTPLARLLGFRTIVTHHAQDYLRPKWSSHARRFLKLGERFSAYFANAVICVSNALYADFLGLYPRARRRTCVIHNAAAVGDMGKPNTDPILKELGLEPGRYILAVGRIEATKGFDQAIAAFRLADRQDYKLVIVGSDLGDAIYAKELRQQASDRVIFAGFQTGDALRRLYEEAALFVHPSHMEGYALVVAEALIADIPVILSDITPHREFGLPEHCYFKPGDIAWLAGMLATKDFGRYAAPEASAAQQRNSWARSARHHLQLYYALLRRTFPSPPATASSKSAQYSAATSRNPKHSARRRASAS